MDVNDLRIAVTLASLARLPGHRWPGPGRRATARGFDEAAHAALRNDD